MSSFEDAQTPQEALDELYAESPSLATAYVVQAVQQQHEAEMGGLLNQAWQAGAQQSEALVSSQIESAWHMADEALTAKYGNEWTEGKDTVLSMVEEHPELIPLEARLSAQEQANRLDFIFKGAREDLRQKRDSEGFEKIKRAGTMTYQDLMAPRWNSAKDED